MSSSANPSSSTSSRSSSGSIIIGSSSSRQQQLHTQRPPSSSHHHHHRQQQRSRLISRETSAVDNNDDDDHNSFYNINWYFPSETLSRELPSVRMGECTLEEDKEYRKTTCAYIQEAGIKLGIPQMAIATAVVFFHRFYAIHSFKQYDRYLVAAACLFLAGKVEETFKKVQDIIVVTEKIKYRNSLKLQAKQQQAATPDESEIDDSKLPVLQPDSPENKELKQRIFQMERILLQTLGFDLKVEHPYRSLVFYVKEIRGDKNLTQVAWNFVNDSFRTALCLQFRPHEIAGATVYLAARFLKHELPMKPSHTPGDERHPPQKPWWELFNTTPQHTRVICNEILDLYAGTEAYKKQFHQLRMDMHEEIPSSKSAHTQDQGKADLKSQSDTMGSGTTDMEIDSQRDTE